MKILHTVNGNIKLSLSSYLVILLISLSISPSITQGEGNRNLLLIGVMAFSPLIIIKYKKFYKSDIWLLLFIVSIVLIPPIAHPESMRWSTVMYSIMFALTFIAYKKLLYRKYFTVENYQKFLKYLIYAYFVVLLIQQFCVLTGLPIFNVSNYNFTEPWKLNSLAAEPSHSARMVAILMYSYIVIKELVKKRKYNFRLDIKQDKWIWIAFLWTMLTMGSATAFLFIVIVLLKFIQFKNLIPLFVIFGLFVILVNTMEITSFERTYKVSMATLTLDEDAIYEADHSAAIRILPMIVSVKMINFTSTNGWFGYGIDYLSTILYKLVPGLPEGSSGGGLFQLWIEYGFISFILFVVFSLFITIKKGDYASIVFWFMIIMFNSVNSQIAWLFIVLWFTNKYFEKNAKNNKLKSRAL